ncbi:MAG: site-specific DNA-methyltransferase [Bacteroidales bacterium]|nr:site-specific DNA-methyltransferase [Bacteroidales bacterium]MDZ4203596.1 site-specific DNA-methyltransferase [Bacteroidales bacterium]
MKLYETLEKQLKKEPNFVTDNGELKKWVVINKAQNYDAELIGLLLDDKELKAKFFIEAKSTSENSAGPVLVFNQALFIQFLEQKNYLNDSYTAYKNKVGLNIDGKYLKQRNEVALVWPYKDCILEGGQSREEDKREEIFFNETLAQDEITQLLEPKVLTNAKHYTAEGEKPLCHSDPERSEGEESLFNRNENGTITDNLIIKGNNLLALHSLKGEFAGKVKLIYIDPPYNTGSDAFKYNDSFNQSTWLTFMRNRLQAGKYLLNDNGFFCCHIDNNEGEYLKVLMDEVFGAENYINTFYIRVRYPDKTLKQDMDFHKEIESIHIYKKSNNAKPILNEIETTIDKYIFYFEEIGKGKEIELGGKKVIVFSKDEIKIVQKESSDKGRKEIWATGSILDGNSSGRFFRDFLTGRYETDGLGVVYKVYGVGDETDGYRYFTGPQKSGATKGKYFQGIPNSQLESENNIRTVPINNFYDLAGSFGNCRSEGGVELRSGKKPEELLKIILSHFSQENDIVLDYHLGSGTTAAVAHKLKRQFIGLEQLDYGDNDSVKRLKNVIAGDATGISKDVNWKGGGSFVYLELKKYNQTFIEQIEEVQTTAALLKIWEDMKSKSFLNYNVDLQKQEEHIEEFKALPLAQQKQHLVELLDKNQLYVNLSSLNDQDFACSEHEKKITKDFYQIRK